jgi:hypothetical protein
VFSKEWVLYRMSSLLCFLCLVFFFSTWYVSSLPHSVPLPLARAHSLFHSRSPTLSLLRVLFLDLAFFKRTNSCSFSLSLSLALSCVTENVFSYLLERVPSFPLPCSCALARPLPPCVTLPYTKPNPKT